MWRIYDELIDCVPPGVTVEECVVGLHWTLVRSIGVGVAMTPPCERYEGVTDAGTMVGTPVRAVAERVKSWNDLDAALGLAAINSVVNAPPEIARTFTPPPPQLNGTNVFEAMMDELEGRKVAVVGHFRGLEPLADVCELTILERCRQPGDLPDPACEYVLASHDYVFVTATALINKTLPRLLELGQSACVVVAGPSAPMTPVLFAHGVRYLAGQMVCDPSAVFRRIREGGRHDFVGGETQMVIFGRQNVRADESVGT